MRLTRHAYKKCAPSIAGSTNSKYEKTNSSLGQEVSVTFGSIRKELADGDAEAATVGGWGWRRFTEIVASGTTGRPRTSSKPAFIDKPSPLCNCICICEGVTTVAGLKRRLHVREARRTKTGLSLSDSRTANHYIGLPKDGMAKRCPPWKSAEHLRRKKEFDQVAAGKSRCHRGHVRAEKLGREMN